MGWGDVDFIQRTLSITRALKDNTCLPPVVFKLGVHHVFSVGMFVLLMHKARIEKDGANRTDKAAFAWE